MTEAAGSQAAGAASVRPLVVGVVADVPDAVITEAASLAADLGSPLLFVTVEPLRYSISTLPDGSVLSMPLDPDVPDAQEETFDPDLAQRVRDLVPHAEAAFLARAGDPAIELARLAEERDARAIAVGTRKPGFRASLEEFLAGSIAVSLAHNQARPVIVIPVAHTMEGHDPARRSAPVDDAS
ncbi:universal stress protein [Humibacter albus]|uniref:universal stress protein n=1 Tax=Humibacter albus TaxID=427754 RepID=UPI0003B55D43|nr:universal stress protein [Humibacter albus]